MRRVLTTDEALALIEAVGGGATIPEVAVHFGVSESTAARVIRGHRHGGGSVVPMRGRPQISRQPFIFRRRSLPFDADPKIIDELHARLRHQPFPFPAIPSSNVLADAVARLRGLRMVISENGEIRPASNTGTRLCAAFFPNRYRATWKSSTSAFDAWHDDGELRKAIRFQVRHGDPVTPERVLRAITLRCRTPTVFRPAVARFIYERYCPSGGRAWDPCAGYGGRLFGASAAGVSYLGTDVDAATVDGNRRLAESVGSNGTVHLAAAETFDPPMVDLVFTSPPYFDQERYSQEFAQSWRKHGKGFETWVSGFLRPVMERASSALAGGGFLVLNVANVATGGKTIPVAIRTVETARALGFVHVETLGMRLFNFIKQNY